ncbi:hypothetical protein ATCC90586_010802 [Pythium insidiosum]|nr:hypothetical protein ATCC90586_010802 [Pythium insidiosum]
MKVQRRECTKPACHPNGKNTLASQLCPVKWKLCLCEASGRWCVLQNDRGHIGTPESVAQVPEVALMTPEIRRFIIKYEEADVKPKKIWSCLRREPEVLQPVGVPPTREQVSSVVKYHRHCSGNRNAIAPVNEHVRSKCYAIGHADDKQLVFSSSLDAKGFPFVGEGSREEPLHLGVTTLRLLCNCLRFGSFDTFGLFHMDATFKLCRLGYPTITCGFSDAQRRYHVAAVFLVSRRTTSDYKAVLDSLNDIVYQVFQRRLRVNAVMADAEDAQLNASNATDPFASGTKLMCFFHVLYNVRKRIKHLARRLQKMVYNGIVDMHYSLSLAKDQMKAPALIRRVKPTTGVIKNR